MRISLSLNQQLNCEAICHKLNKMIESYQKENNNIQECLLVVDIKKPLEYIGDNPLPKLESQQ